MRLTTRAAGAPGAGPLCGLLADAAPGTREPFGMLIEAWVANGAACPAR